MDDKDLRAYTANCTLGEQTGPQTIVVRQVIGEGEKQKVLDIHVRVPERKPAIEQIVDVFVKDVCIDTVDVITDKVIVRGEFEVKAIYVACLPQQPVHAVELKNYRWTADIVVPGARKGMDADADVIVEYVDYDIDEECNDNDHHHHHHRHFRNRGTKYTYYKNTDWCDDDDDDCNHHHDDCDDDDDDDVKCPPGTREFDVSVVLKVTAKVMTAREVVIGGALPSKPKG